MLYEQLLHDFVDGSLSYGDEVVLFAELGSNEELRGELKLLLLMQQAVASDARAYTPTPASQEAIFQRLGFTPSAPRAPIGRNPVGRAPLGRTFRWFAQFAISGLVGALAATAVFLLVDRNLAPALPPATAAAATATSAAKPTSGSQEQHDADVRRSAVMIWSQALAVAEQGKTGAVAFTMPTAPARRSPVSAFAPAVVHRTTARTIARTAAMPPVRSTPLAERAQDALDPADGMRTATSQLEGGTPQAITSTAIMPTAITPVRLRGTEDAGIPNTSAAVSSDAATSTDIARLHAPADAPLAISPTSDALLGTPDPIGVTYRTLGGRDAATVPASLTGSGSGLVDDRAVGITWRIDPAFTVGAAAGREAFFQRFTEQRPNGDLLLHEQRPMMTWLGATCRYSLATGSRVSPFAEMLLGTAFAGTSPVGPLGRAMLGADYAVTEDLRLFAGAEVSALAYRFGGSWHGSPKYGYTYGFSLLF